MPTTQTEPSLSDLHRRVGELTQTVHALVRHLSAFPTVTDLPGVSQPISSAPAWSLRQPRRNDALSWPIYLVLKDAHQRGMPKPSAMEVLEAFGKKRPPEVIELMPREVKYLSLCGVPMSAGLEDIRGRIYRMTVHKADANRMFSAQA